MKNFKTKIRRNAIVQGLGRAGRMDYSWICFQVLSGELTKVFKDLFYICYNMITSINHTIYEKHKGGRKGFQFNWKWTHSLSDSLVDKTSYKGTESAMGSKTLQDFILSFKLIDMVSQLKLHQETRRVELWDMPASSLTDLRVALGNL